MFVVYILGQHISFLGDSSCAGIRMQATTILTGVTAIGGTAVLTELNRRQHPFWAVVSVELTIVTGFS
jgi:hypothetical protein